MAVNNTHDDVDIGNVGICDDYLGGVENDFVTYHLAHRRPFGTGRFVSGQSANEVAAVYFAFCSTIPA